MPSLGLYCRTKTTYNMRAFGYTSVDVAESLLRSLDGKNNGPTRSKCSQHAFFLLRKQRREDEQPYLRYNQQIPLSLKCCFSSFWGECEDSERRQVKATLVWQLTCHPCFPQTPTMKVR